MKYKYTVEYKRLLGFLAGVLIYSAISLYASLGLGSNLAMGVAIHLSLSAITSVVVLFLVFKPIERKEINEKAQATPSCGDCAPDSGHP